MRYAIRELGVGGILDQAFTLIKDHLGVLLGITGILIVPYYAIGGLIQVAMAPTLPPNPTQEQQLAALSEVMRFVIPFQLIGAYIIAPITNAALVYAIANTYLEKPISVGDSFKRAFGRIFPLIWTWFLVFLAIMGGMFLCLVPGILAAFWFSMATQVVVLEDQAGIAAMKRSKRLVAGNIGTMFVLGLLIGAINGGLGFAAGLIPQPHAQAIATAIVMAISIILSSAAFVVFYFSCRCKHEQFDLALLAQSVGEKPPADELEGDPELEWR